MLSLARRQGENPGPYARLQASTTNQATFATPIYTHVCVVV